MLLTTDAELRTVLHPPRSVAVLGAKDSPSEPAFYVPAYLATAGFSVVGINPKLAGSAWLGRPAVASLADLPGRLEIIEVFRRSDSLVPIAAEILDLPWRPAVVWFQLGIVNAEATKMLVDKGISVVESRCMMPEHRRLVGRA